MRLACKSNAIVVLGRQAGKCENDSSIMVRGGTCTLVFHMIYSILISLWLYRKEIRVDTE